MLFVDWGVQCVPFLLQRGQGRPSPHLVFELAHATQALLTLFDGGEGFFLSQRAECRCRRSLIGFVSFRDGILITCRITYARAKALLQIWQINDL